MRISNSAAILLGTLALIALSVPALAASHMKHGSMSGHKGHGQMMEQGDRGMMGDMSMCLEHGAKMGLTEAQIDTMKPLHREMQKKHARFIADQKIAEIELAEIMEVKDFNLEKAEAAVKKIAGIKTAHQVAGLTAMKEMRTMLTDQQYKEMKKMMSAGTIGKKPARKHSNKHK